MGREGREMQKESLHGVMFKEERLKKKDSEGKYTPELHTLELWRMGTASTKTQSILASTRKSLSCVVFCVY